MIVVMLFLKLMVTMPGMKAWHSHEEGEEKKNMSEKAWRQIKKVIMPSLRLSSRKSMASFYLYALSLHMSCVSAAMKERKMAWQVTWKE